MLIHPPFLYKYKYLPKAIHSEDDELMVERVIDIIKNHRIYLPLWSELNDPIEASSVYIQIAAAGGGTYRSLGRIHPVVGSRLDRYRVLSLADVPDCMPMWANYANDSAGVCLAFSTIGALGQVQPIVYTKTCFVVREPENFEEAVKETLLFKQISWSYEGEWRLVIPAETKFLTLDEQLCGVIIGKNAETKIHERILKACNENNVLCCDYQVIPGKGKMEFYPADIKVEPLYDWDYERDKIWPDGLPEFLSLSN